MTYEEWRCTYQDAEQAAMAAWKMAQEAKAVEFESNVLRIMRGLVSSGRMIELSKRGGEYMCEIFVPVNSGVMRGYEGRGLTMIGAFESAMQIEEADQ